LSDHFDYIIAGAGCAGSSLLSRMMDDPFFSNKRILVFDHSEKKENDRTWCFWEKEAGHFESIVYHHWKKVGFFSPSFNATLDISPYTYKMIRGIDLYESIRERVAEHPNITWRNEKILSVTNEKDGAAVLTETGKFSAKFVFSTILFEKPVIAKGEYFLWQHFLGWVIETKDPAFDPATATFMDFRISQEKGTAFMYVLPLTTTTALVEYALFSEDRLPVEDYEAELKKYVIEKLGLADFSIMHSEFGMIPMTNKRFRKEEGNTINVGVVGGEVKGSTGYAFQFIQKRAAAIISSLKATGRPGGYSNQNRYRFYDGVLLRILHEKKMSGAEIFAAIFRNNPPERILCFLDNESSLTQDLQIMASVPSSVFLPAGLIQLIKSL
jgi:lycopene beta-cyclase